MRYWWVLVLSSMLLACSQEPSYQVLKIQGATMGTHYHIAWVGLDAKQAQPLQMAVDERLQAINKSMSTYDPQSELSRLNKGDLAVDTQGNITLSADLTEVLAKSLQIWQQSAGKFDITVGPLVNLWGFGPEARIDAAPAVERITERLAKIGSQHLKLDVAAQKLHLDSPQYIDLSAIAKGWGVDQIALLLEKQGIQNYMVEIGGEVRTKGQKPDAQPWRIAIERPDPDVLEQQAALIIAPRDTGIATSGSYRNYFENNGVRYSHTIDPATGYPITHKLVSITVLHKEAGMADGWATAIDVAGPELGLQLAETYKLPIYMLVAKDGGGFSEVTSSEFRKLFPEVGGEEK
jgi:thiamine biosynthesis lipoprotein